MMSLIAEYIGLSYHVLSFHWPMSEQAPAYIYIYIHIPYISTVLPRASLKDIAAHDHYELIL